jgi:hypothetical protein
METMKLFHRDGALARRDAEIKTLKTEIGNLQQERSSALWAKNRYYDKWIQLRAQRIVVDPRIEGMLMIEYRQGWSTVLGKDVETLEFVFASEANLADINTPDPASPVEPDTPR